MNDATRSGMRRSENSLVAATILPTSRHTWLFRTIIVPLSCATVTGCTPPAAKPDVVDDTQTDASSDTADQTDVDEIDGDGQADAASQMDTQTATWDGVDGGDTAHTLQFGQPCAKNADCASGLCTAASGGKLCSSACPPACPTGFYCHPALTAKIPAACWPDDLCSTSSDCDDKNQCTSDVCGANLKCKHTGVEGACDDGNPCTSFSFCSTSSISGNAICVGQGCMMDQYCPATVTDAAKPCLAAACTLPAIPGTVQVVDNLTLLDVSLSCDLNSDGKPDNGLWNFALTKPGATGCKHPVYSSFGSVINLFWPVDGGTNWDVTGKAFEVATMPGRMAPSKPECLGPGCTVELDWKQFDKSVAGTCPPKISGTLAANVVGTAMIASGAKSAGFPLSLWGVGPSTGCQTFQVPAQKIMLNATVAGSVGWQTSTNGRLCGAFTLAAVTAALDERYTKDVAELFKTTLPVPDLDTDGDGKADAISFAYSFSTVTAPTQPPAASCSSKGCDDGLACTEDHCNNGAGGPQCLFTVATCAGGLACAEPIGCPAGLCKGGCDDGDGCTIDTCNASAACVHTPSPGCADATSDSGAADADAGAGEGDIDDGSADAEDIAVPACAAATIVVAEGAEVIPQTTLHLKGSGSTGASGQPIKTYKWTAKQPGGSNKGFQPSSSFPNPTFVPDVAGNYEFCLEVTDDSGAKACALTCYTVQVVPSSTVHVELLWDTPSDPDQTDLGPGAGADMDLHFANDLASGPDTDCDGLGDPWFNNPLDAFWFNSAPQWGSVDTTVKDDPTLDLDDTDGAGPEILNLESPEGTELLPRSYAIGVHYWNDHGFGVSNSTITVYIFGTVALKVAAIPMNPLDMWNVGKLNWPNQLNGGTAPPITVCHQSGDTCTGKGKMWESVGDSCITPCYVNKAFAASTGGSTPPNCPQTP